MHIEIRITQQDYEQLYAHLFQPDNLEWAAYLFTGPTVNPNHLILTVREVWLVPADAYAFQSAAGIEVKAEYVKEVLRHTRTTGLSLLDTHSHPFASYGVTFSGIDTGDEKSKFPYVATKIPYVNHSTMVFGRESVDAHLYDPVHCRVIPVDQLTILGTPLRRLIPTSACSRQKARLESDRYRRQVLAFGSAGQAALQRLMVGIVGLGSVGMLLAQQLAYLGVRDFVCVDYDKVEVSNLNRLVGATPADAHAGIPKVEVAKRLITAIAPDARVESLPLSLTDPRAHHALRTVDVLFGGADNDGARLLLNDRLSVQYLIPYIDVGTGLETDGDGRITHAGGWVRVALPGRWCLHCIRAIDREQAARDLLSPGARERAWQQGYLAGEDVAAPAVIFLNSVVASLAVAEFMNLVTGFKPPHELILYDLLKQRSTPVAVSRREDCPSCSPEALLALGDLEPFPSYGEDPCLPAPSGKEQDEKEQDEVEEPKQTYRRKGDLPWLVRSR